MKRGESKGDGFFQTKTGWGYRIVLKKDGKTIKDITRSKDENGKAFATKSEAKKARAAHLLKLQEETEGEKTKQYNITFLEAWELYETTEAKAKAESTVKKHKSVWENHIKAVFGNKEMNDVTIVELNDFLCNEYGTGLKHAYVTSFLKVFYLLYGVANRAERIDPAKYARMFVNKETRLQMAPPREEDEDADDITAYDSAQISIIAKVCKSEDDGDIYPLFLLCYCCGLRLGEALGLLWDDIDYANNTISITKQLQPTDNQLFMLCKLKTKNARRVIDMPQMLRDELSTRHRVYCKKKDDAEMKNTEKVIDKRKAKQEVLVGADFVNRRGNGALITQNSTKKVVKLIKAAGVDDFHFHALRSTYASQLAAANVSPSEVMRHLGHSKFDTTLKYYINSTIDARKQLQTAINNITTEEKIYLVSVNGEEYKEMTETQLKAFKDFASRNPTSKTTIEIIEKPE